MTTLISRPVRPAALLALAAALTLAVLAVLPLPAHAHDTLIETDPSDGETLETSPEAITLTYSADVLEVSPVVRIDDADGEPVSEVTPTVDGPTVTAELEEPLAAGTYTVQWRVVSSDGHPIEGSFTFDVEQDTAGAAPSDEGSAAGDGGGGEASDAGGAEESASSTASDAGGSAEDGSGGGASEGDTSSESATEDSGSESSAMPLLLGIVGVAVVGVAIAAFFTLRKRR
ncbi:copper resistance CopC family protein [Brachybacterium sp.]|uniref:copper resistance CopC family protein n=1 Tax=Brachybacterium sp. TaxID=1891286 RepID=UPI002649F3F4|nr:copper resistance CopC family protein [Brachybacterium sp.]